MPKQYIVVLKVKLGVDKDIKYVYFLLTLMMCTSYVELCTLHVYLSILGGIHVLELDNYCVSIHWYRINIGCYCTLFVVMLYTVWSTVLQENTYWW